MKRRIATLCVGGVLALALFGVAAAGPLEDGQAAYQKGDYATAIRLIRPLAEQGNAIAQDILGFMCDHGQGVPQDYAQAIVWYRKAAELGNANAQGNLGKMYATGQGVLQDYEQAVKWMRKAANQGDANAQGGIGAMYMLGQGVPHDRVLAYMWFNLAAAQGDPVDAKSRDVVAAYMSPAQIAEAQRMAREWKPK